MDPRVPSFSASPIDSEATRLLAAIAPTASASSVSADADSITKPSRPTTSAAVTPSTFRSASRMPRSPAPTTSTTAPSLPSLSAGPLACCDAGATTDSPRSGRMAWPVTGSLTYPSPIPGLHDPGVEHRGNFRHEAAELQPGLADVPTGVDADAYVIVLPGHGQENDVALRDQHDVVDRASIHFLAHVVEHLTADRAFLGDLLDREVGIHLQGFDRGAIHADHDRAHQPLDPAHQ